ncbi:hypothetical protein [Bacillus sp. NPDC094106]|uniref:hypothetical protein n=1 Tax=Bacillus sp. NPDC094106 TaxID=3363949 RepID=UPI003820DD43
MSLTYDKLMSLLESNKDIKEFELREGHPLFLGILKKLDEPIIINGMVFTEGIFSEKCDIFGITHRNECLNVLQGFESLTKKTLTPNEKNSMILFDNDKFRLTVFDKPVTPNGFDISYREYLIKTVA